MSVASHFEGRPLVLRRMYRAWLAFVRRHGGPVTVSPNRTRITFMAEVRFAGCVAMRDRLRCNFALARRVGDPRFTEVKEEVPGWWAHRFELAGDTRVLDARLGRLVAESYREFGMRGRLTRARGVTPGRARTRRTRETPITGGSSRASGSSRVQR
ncbi:MAG TPA: DUF5655 domain-containing protein [Dongiaceae bacterium]|nr:DUF5655 domain-containing protein [Dongiaceae bacterium]